MKRNVLLRLGAFAGCAAAVVVLYVFLLSVLRGKLGSWSSVIPAAVLAFGMIGLNRAFFRMEGWSLSEIGLTHWRLRDAAVGILFGFLLVGLWALAYMNAAGVDWQPVTPSPVGAMAGGLIFLLLNNLAEELAYRAYAFLLLQRILGANVAILLTSGIFAILHIQGGVPWQSAIAVVFTTALVYGATLSRTSNLLVVWMTHVAMNIAQEVIGLRSSALTLLAPHTPLPLSATKSIVVLVIIGGITTAIALAIRFRRTLEGKPFVVLEDIA